MNNGELKAEIIRFSKRDDLTAYAQSYVDRAGDMIARKGRTLEMVKFSTISDGLRIGSTGVYNMPSDYQSLIAVYGIQGATAYKVRMVSTAEIRRYDASAPPIWGSITDRRIEFRGVPVAGTVFDISYFGVPFTLGPGDATSNTVLAATPELYLHGALHWLHLEAQDIDMAQAHLDLFTSTIEDLNRMAARGMAAGAVSMDEAASTFGSSM